MADQWNDRKTLTIKGHSYHKLRQLKADLEEESWESFIEFLHTNRDKILRFKIKVR